VSTISPQLATIGRSLPAGDEWVFEPKYDGIRILAFADRGRVALISRNGIDKARQFPEVVEAVAALKARVKSALVLDGEIVATRAGDPARFQRLQGRMHVTDAGSIRSLRRSAPAALIAFDLLLEGRHSLVNEPWRTRREHLVALFRRGGRSRSLRLGEVGDDGEAMLRRARRSGWEGVIAKRAAASYAVGRRTRDWLKLKIERRQEFVVGGWTEPRKSREHVGAILVGYYDDDGELIYAGHTGTGFTRESLADMYRRLSRIERTSSPFTVTPRTNEPAHWTRPSVVVEIKFNEWTSEGRLRQPVFVGIRDDKDAREVIREPESMARSSHRESGRVRTRSRRRVAAATMKTRARRKPTLAKRPPARASRRRSTTRGVEAVVRQLDTIEKTGGSGALALPGGALEVTNLDKVYFPKTGHTKGDLMRYYARVAPMLLPAIADRPLVMRRFPNGVRGHAFYQQKAPATAPEIVRIERVVDEKDEGLTPADRLVGGDLATLLYVVQLGAISIDPWHSRVPAVYFADYSIIDLDPGKHASFLRVVEVAHVVKEVLDELGLHAIPKTSGASGLHVVLPLGPRVPNDGARMLAELVATHVAERAPKIATVERSVSKRPSGTVYVDYLQNIRGKTVAGVYSVRAQPVPMVSTPLSWREVTERLAPESFTIDTVPERLRRTGDLWAKAMRRPNSLDRALARV
jgi:bifunctional non-homologous end joining protein LigD